MYRIALCVEEEVRKMLEPIIQQYLSSKCIESSITHFISPEDLYCEMNCTEGTEIDLLFLQIESTGLGIDPISLGNWIRNEKKDEWIQIIYLSKSQEACIQCMETRPFNYRLIPLDCKQIMTDVQNVMEVQRVKNDVYIYKNGGKTQIVNIKDIMYFESNAHKIDIVMLNQKKGSFYNKICNVAKELRKYNFFWIHNSFLVNYHYIQQISPTQLTLVDGTTLPISKAYKKNIEMCMEQLITI